MFLHKFIKIINSWKKSIFFISGFSFFILTIFLSSWWSTFSQSILIKNIIISETNILQSEHYSNLLKNFLGSELSTKNLYEIGTVLESHPYVKVARISKRYPTKIKVEIVERKPIAILQIEPMVLLDKEGVVLPNVGNLNNYNLPIMTNFNPEISLYPFGNKVLSVNVAQCIHWLN